MYFVESSSCIIFYEENFFAEIPKKEKIKLLTPTLHFFDEWADFLDVYKKKKIPHFF